MPGTIVYNGKYISDVIAKSNFKAEDLPQPTELTPAVYETLQDEEGNDYENLVTPATHDNDGWDILYQGTKNSIIIPLAEEFINYQADVVEYDEEGVEISRARPTELNVPHAFGGWPFRGVSYVE